MVQRKRSTSNVTSKPGSGSTKASAKKSKTSRDEEDDVAPPSPSSVTSSTSFQRKRPSTAKGDFEETKRPKQHQEKDGEEGDKDGEADQDAAQALTSLAQNS